MCNWKRILIHKMTRMISVYFWLYVKTLNIFRSWDYLRFVVYLLSYVDTESHYWWPDVLSVRHQLAKRVWLSDLTEEDTVIYSDAV